MTSTEAHHIEVVRNYFAGCNSGDLDALLSTLAPESGRSRLYESVGAGAEARVIAI